MMDDGTASEMSLDRGQRPNNIIADNEPPL